MEKEKKEETTQIDWDSSKVYILLVSEEDKGTEHNTAAVLRPVTVCVCEQGHL